MKPPYRSRLHVPPAARPTPTLRPVCGDLIEVDVDRPHRWYQHRHPDYEAILAERGVYRCLINGERVEVRPGRLLLIKPGDVHVDLLEPPLRYVALQFRLQPSPSPGPSAFAPDAGAGMQVVDADREMRSTLDRLRAIAADPSLAAAGLREALVAEFFWRIVRAMPSQALARPFRTAVADRAFADRLAAALDAALERPRPVSTLAADLGMSESALTHRCRAVLGVSPARALRDRRMDHARLLLERSGESVKDIAKKLCFADQFHFSRAFKRRHGFPPSRLRPPGG